MLPATFLKIAISALATVPAGFARPLGSGPGGANTDLQVRDAQIDTRAFVVDEIFGRDLVDDYVSARELDEGVQELDLRQFAAIGMWAPCYPFCATSDLTYSFRHSQDCA